MLALIWSFFGAGRIAGIAEAALKFLSSWTALAILGIGVVWYAYASGASSERKACNAEQVAAENAALKASLDKARAINDENRQQLEREQLAVDQLQEKVASYAKQREQDKACLPTAADIERDRDIRGVR